MELFNVGGMCPETNYIFMGESCFWLLPRIRRWLGRDRKFRDNQTKGRNCIKGGLIREGGEDITWDYGSDCRPLEGKWRISKRGRSGWSIHREWTSRPQLQTNMPTDRGSTLIYHARAGSHPHAGYPVPPPDILRILPKTLFVLHQLPFISLDTANPQAIS
jgi:hypothetical protein